MNAINESIEFTTEELQQRQQACESAALQIKASKMRMFIGECRRRQQRDLNHYYLKLIDLKNGQRLGSARGAAFFKDEYILLEAAEGFKRTSCLDAARFFAGLYTFEQVEEIVDNTNL